VGSVCRARSHPFAAASGSQQHANNTEPPFWLQASMSVHAISAVLKITGVSSSEKLILLILSNYADEHNRSFPSHRRLANESGLSDRTVLTVLKALEVKKLISRKERNRPDGSRSSDIITLHIGGEMVSPGGEMNGRGVGKSTTGGGEMVSPLTTFEPLQEEPLKKEREVQAPSPKRSSNGFRLPDDWEPTPWTEESPIDLMSWKRELGIFRDYWKALPGARGRKLDWDATWRIWISRTRQSHSAQPKLSLAEQIGADNEKARQMAFARLKARNGQH